MLDQPLDDDIAEAVCNDCWLHSEEYEELSTTTPLFDMAMDFIARRNAKLPDDRTYSYSEEQAILIVHVELEKWKSDEIKKDKKSGERSPGSDHREMEG